MNYSAGALKKVQPHPRLAKFVSSVTFFIFLALATVFAVLIYLMMAPVSGVTITSTKLVSEKLTYEQGDVVHFTSPGEYCNNGGYTVTLARDYSSEVGFIRLPIAGAYSPPEPYCEANAVFQSSIPEDLPPGKWQLVLRITYKANPVRTVTLTQVSNFFTVSAPTAK